MLVEGIIPGYVWGTVGSHYLHKSSPRKASLSLFRTDREGLSDFPKVMEPLELPSQGQKCY